MSDRFCQKLAVVAHEDMELHEGSLAHPESPGRLQALFSTLMTEDWNDKLVWCRPDPASLEAIQDVHTRGYVSWVEEACLRGEHALDDGDTQVCPDSFLAARLSAGAAITAVDAVLRDGFKSAFSISRPPGHHAAAALAGGFCIFNNVAIAARYAQKEYGCNKVLIIDWDVHHGNGTQDIFYQDADVFFVSLHQFPFYPGSGAATETGSDAGIGYTLNVPLAAKTSAAEYKQIFAATLEKVLAEFTPDLVILSAGFDAHAKDLMGDLLLSAEDFGALTDEVGRQLAATGKAIPLISVLEGGYNLKSLTASVEAHLEGLLRLARPAE